MTKDADFADLVLRKGTPAQILWITCGNTSNAARIRTLEHSWPRISRLLADGEPLVEIGSAVEP